MGGFVTISERCLVKVLQEPAVGPGKYSKASFARFVGLLHLFTEMGERVLGKRRKAGTARIAGDRHLEVLQLINYKPSLLSFDHNFLSGNALKPCEN